MKEKINIAVDRLFAKPLIGIPVSILAFYFFMLLGKLAPSADEQVLAATGVLTVIIPLFTICFYVIFSLILLRKSGRNVIMDNFVKV